MQGCVWVNQWFILSKNFKSQRILAAIPCSVCNVRLSHHFCVCAQHTLVLSFKLCQCFAFSPVFRPLVSHGCHLLLESSRSALTPCSFHYGLRSFVCIDPTGAHRARVAAQGAFVVAIAKPFDNAAGTKRVCARKGVWIIARVTATNGAASHRQTQCIVRKL